jgi:centrosomal protein CEP104
VIPEIAQALSAYVGLNNYLQVATRIEVHVGLVPETRPTGDHITWRRLGGLSLDSNERSHFKARELKSVQLHAEAAYLRIVVHRCHVNKLNIYNQVRLL